MTPRKSTKSLTWVKRTTSAMILVVGIGAILYSCIQYSSLSRIDDDKRKSIGKSGGPSKIIIITKSISQKDGLDWFKLLQNDIVLVVIPKISFLNSNADKETSSNLHKIIRCDTIIGLWSCVKHLQKDQLLYIEEEIPDGLPKDIHKYIPELISCEDAHDLSSKF